LTLTLRLATLEDVPRLERLIDLSVRGLSEGYYSPAQVESGIRYVFGPDSQLIRDGTYFCVEAPDEIVGCGGWSRRKTHYGGDQVHREDDGFLDPREEPARIRAFFVHPAWARRGIGRMLLDASSSAAQAAGFGSLTLSATLPGEPMYRACGFSVVARKDVQLPDGVHLTVVQMQRALEPAR
jgi:GNAT superfamily N-acetyltransferase